MTLEELSVLIDMEAKGLMRDEGLCYEEVAVISSMQIVNALIGYRIDAEKENAWGDYKGNVAEKGWAFSYGSCGTRTYILMDILKNLRIPAREIQFWHIDGNPVSHIACEVYYNDSWHYFDPSWCLYFRGEDSEILSFHQIVSLPKTEAYSYLVMDWANVKNVREDFRSSVYNLIERESDIGIEGNSEIHCDFERYESLSNVPTYIGISHNWGGKLSEVKWVFVSDPDLEEIIVFYDFSNTCAINVMDENGRCVGTLSIGGNTGEIHLENEILLQDNVTLEVAEKQKVNYLHFRKIEAVFKDGTHKILD